MKVARRADLVRARSVLCRMMTRHRRAVVPGLVRVAGHVVRAALDREAAADLGRRLDQNLGANPNRDRVQVLDQVLLPDRAQDRRLVLDPAAKAVRPSRDQRREVRIRNRQ